MPQTPSNASSSQTGRFTQTVSSNFQVAQQPDLLLLANFLMVVIIVVDKFFLSTLFFVVLLVGLIGLPFFYMRKDNFPGWVARMMESVLARISAFPFIVMSVPTLGALVILEYVTLNKSSHLIHELLVVFHLIFAVFLSMRSTRALTNQKGSGLFSLNTFFKEPEKTHVITSSMLKDELESPPQPARLTKIEKDAPNEHLEKWEQKQKQRWEEWMQEELDRLNGEYDGSRHDYD